MINSAKFKIGEIVEHIKFEYRGVVFEVDPVFSLSEDWYERVALSRPPKDKPWYHVLVDNAVHSTYVAERHLRAAENTGEITHPALDRYFSVFSGGAYQPKQILM